MTREPLDAETLRRRLLVPEGPLARLDVVGESASTNTTLVEAVRAAPSDWPAPAALVAEHQLAGRGRAGRSWETPPRAALTVSVLLRPAVPTSGLGWVPLLAGIAVARTVRHAGAEARVKWPNDVVVPAATPVPGLGPFRKVAGILAEVVPGVALTTPPAVVVGVGLNVTQTPEELPVTTATSLAIEGAATDRTALLVRLLRELTGVVGRFEDTGGDATASGLAREYADLSATLGTRVRAELAGGSGIVEGTVAGIVEGVAVRLDDGGGLVVATPDGERVVTAGDVHHLRAAD